MVEDETSREALLRKQRCATTAAQRDAVAQEIAELDLRTCHRLVAKVTGVPEKAFDQGFDEGAVAMHFDELESAWRDREGTAEAWLAMIEREPQVKEWLK